MKPKDMLDEHVSYMAGNLKGWADAGGSLEEWASRNRLSTEDIITLDARIREITERVVTGRNAPTKGLADAWVVEWSHSQQAIHIQTLANSLELNIEMIADSIVPDYTIISVWGSHSEAMVAAKTLEPLLRKFS